MLAYRCGGEKMAFPASEQRARSARAVGPAGAQRLDFIREARKSDPFWWTKYMRRESGVQQEDPRRHSGQGRGKSILPRELLRWIVVDGHARTGSRRAETLKGVTPHRIDRAPPQWRNASFRTASVVRRHLAEGVGFEPL